MKTEVQKQVSLARAFSVLAVRYAAAEYPQESRRARRMSAFHMTEARTAAKKQSL